MLWTNNKPMAVTLSYDDGYIHDRRFVELLNRYGLKCTFNLNSSKLSSDITDIDYSLPYDKSLRNKKISKSEVRYLYKGHEVASHTKDHVNLTDTGTINCYRQIL